MSKTPLVMLHINEDQFQSKFIKINVNMFKIIQKLMKLKRYWFQKYLDDFEGIVLAMVLIGYCKEFVQSL